MGSVLRTVLLALVLSTCVFARPGMDEDKYLNVATPDAPSVLECGQWALGYIQTGRLSCVHYCVLCATTGICTQYIGEGCRNQ